MNWVDEYGIILSVDATGHQLISQCLHEAGDDVIAGLQAAVYILTTQPTPAVEQSLSINAYFSHDIHNRAAQGILNRSLKAARGLSATARRDLSAAIKRGEQDSGEAILEFINKYRLQLANLLTTTQLAALLEGASEVAAKVAPLDEVPIEGLPVAEQENIIEASAKPTPSLVVPPESAGIHLHTIDEAVKHLAEKNVIDRAGFDALDAAARAKAFTVANVAAEETLTKIRDSLAANVAEGADYEDWRKKVLQDVNTGTFLSDAHQETVFRTNVQSAFSDGQASVLAHPLVRSGFPYSTYDAIHDERVRENHLALESLGINGTNVYRNDDPVFHIFRPPWDYSDRCGWTPTTVRQAAEMGVPEAQEWLRTGVEPADKAFVPMPPFAPPPGFARSVSAAPLSIQLSMQSINVFLSINPVDLQEDERNQLTAEILLSLFGADAKQEAINIVLSHDDIELTIVGTTRYGHKSPGKGWQPAHTGPRGGRKWVYVGTAPNTPAPTPTPTPAPTPAPTSPPVPTPTGPAPSANALKHQQRAAAATAAHANALAKIAANTPMTATEKKDLAKHLTQMTISQLRSLYTGLGGTAPVVGGQRQPWSNAIKAILNGTVPTTAPTPTPPAPVPPPPAPTSTPTPTPAPTPLPTPTPPTTPVPGHKVLAKPTAPTPQTPINLNTAPAIAYGGKNGGQIDPTWSGLDYPGIDAKYGAVIARTDATTGKVQVLLAKPKSYYGNTSWTWAKGGKDPNEDAVDTAAREAMEEVGADGIIVGHLSGTYTENSKSGLNAYFIMRQNGAIDDAAWKANGESEDVQWIDIDQAHTLINETAQHISDPNGSKAPSFVNWQRDADVLEQAKEALIPGYTAKVNRRVDVLPPNLQDKAGQIRAVALAAHDGLIPVTQAQIEISSIMPSMTGSEIKDIASTMRAGAGSSNDFLAAVAKADPGHPISAPSPPGPPPRPGLIWNPTTHRWVLAPAPPPPPAPTAGAPPPTSAARTPIPFVPKTGKLNKGDYEDLDYRVGKELTSLGLTAEQALQQRASSRIYNSLQSNLDYSVGQYEIERTLKHLWAQQTTVPIPAQFDHFGTKRKKNAALPNEARPKLSQDEIVAAQKWTSSAYIPWARGLREVGSPPPQFAKEHADLQSAFSKAKVFNTPVAVERHLNVNPTELSAFVAAAQASLANGTAITYPSYQASSTDPVPANFHGNIEMRINAVHGLDMGPHHHHPHVKELLLNHNSQFQVTSIQQVGGRWIVGYDQLPPAAAPKGRKKASAAPAPVAKPVHSFSSPWASPAVQDFISGKIKITSSLPGGGTDYPLFNALMAESGRADKAQVLDKNAVDALVASGWTQQYRGVTDQKYTNQFRDQDVYTDQGSGARVYGQGVYIQTSLMGAKGYGQHVLRVALPKKIKKVSTKKLKTLQNAAIAAIRNDSSLSWSEKNSRLDVMRDDGLCALLHNYDMIDVGSSTGYRVLLNRSIVAVQDKDL